MNPEQNAPVPDPLAPVAASPAVAQPVASPAPVAAPRGRWKVAVAATAVAVLAAAGAGYAWAYRGAETVVPEAFRLAGEAATVRAEAEADFSVDVNGYEVEASLSFEGAADQTDRLNPKMDFRFEAEFDGMRGEGAARFVDENFYFQISEVPGLALAGAEEVEAFVGQWFFVSVAEMEAASGQSFADLFAQAEANRAESVQNFDRLFSSGAFSFGPAKVFSAGGELVREYSVNLDSAALADFAVAEMNRLATTTETRDAVAEAEPVIRAILPGVSLEEGAVRVALLSGELREVRGTLVVNFDAMDQEVLGGDDATVGAEMGADLACEIGPDGEPSVGCYAADPEPAEPLSGSVRAKFAARYSGFGEPVEIEAPAGAVSVSDALGYGAYDPSVFGSAGAEDYGAESGDPFLLDAQQKAGVASQKAALSNLRPYAEIYADGSSYAGFCESAPYLESLPLLEAAGAPAQCLDQDDAWSVTAYLVDGTFFCVDNLGSVAELSARPAGPYCE